MNEDAIETLKDTDAAVDEIAEEVGDLRPPAILLGEACIPLDKIVCWFSNDISLRVHIVGAPPIQFADLTGHLRKTLQQAFRFLPVSED